MKTPLRKEQFLRIYPIQVFGFSFFFISSSFLPFKGCTETLFLLLLLPILVLLTFLSIIICS